MSFKPLSCHFNPLSCALPGVGRVNSGIFPFPQNICMLNFVCLPSLHRQSSEQTAASSRPLVRQLMCSHGSLSRFAGPVCVRAVQTLRGCRVHQRLLRQRSSPFASGQALRGPPQKGLPTPTGRHAETEGRSTPAGTFLTWIQGACLQELCSPWLFAVIIWSILIRTICLMQATNSKIPTSILKRPSPIYGSDIEPNHRRKGERRVRFREPETTVHGENTGLCWTFYSQTSLFSHTETRLSI